MDGFQKLLSLTAGYGTLSEGEGWGEASNWQIFFIYKQNSSMAAVPSEDLEKLLVKYCKFFITLPMNDLIIQH